MSEDPRAATGALGSGVIFNTLGSASGPLAAVLTAPLLARGLGVDGRGAVAAANASLVFVTSIATLGLPDAVTYFTARSPAAARAVTRAGVMVSIATGLGSMAVIALASRWLAGGSGQVRQLIVLSCLAIVPTLLAGVLRGTAQGLGRWRLVALERSGASVARLAAIGVLFATGKLTVMSATIVIAATPLIGLALYARLTRRPASAQQAQAASPDRGEFVSYGLRVWAGSIAGIVLSRLDQVLITPLAGATALGIYVVAVTVGDLPVVINNAFREVAFAGQARASANESLTASARMAFTLTALAGIVLGSSGMWWIPAVFGEAFSAAVLPAIVLLAAAVISPPGSIAGAGLAARGMPGIRSASMVIACVANVGLLLALAGPLGALGAALATLAGSVLANALNLAFAWRRLGIAPSRFCAIGRAEFRALAQLPGRLARRPHAPAQAGPDDEGGEA